MLQKSNVCFTLRLKRKKKKSEMHSKVLKFGQRLPILVAVLEAFERTWKLRLDIWGCDEKPEFDFLYITLQFLLQQHNIYSSNPILAVWPHVFRFHVLHYFVFNSYHHAKSTAILVYITMQVHSYSTTLYMPITHNGNDNLERGCHKLAYNLFHMFEFFSGEML